MIDTLTTTLAVPALACYVVGATPTWQNVAKTCHVYLSDVGGIPCFMFKGTEDAREWLIDFNPLETADPTEPDIGRVHADSLHNVRDVLPFITAHMAALNWSPFYIAGHSKGAREAPIAHALLKHLGHAPVATRLYEPPRPGGDKLTNYLATDNIIGTQTHNSHGTDIVTLVPFGFGWEPACHLIKLRVPDTFSVIAKHVMTGVVTGLNG